MSEDPADDAPAAKVPPQGDPGDERPGRSETVRLWRRRVLVGGGGLIALIIVWFFAASFVPRWWAQRVGGLVDGSFSRGVLWGLFFGFVFTFIPLLIAGIAIRRSFRWKARVGVILAALVLAVPNLMTLGVVLGRGNGAHAGERILDVEGPAFRGATLGGALAGAAFSLGIVVVLAVMRRRGRQLDTMRRNEADQGKAAR